MERHILICSFNPGGDAGYDVYRAAGESYEKCGSFMPQVSAGVTVPSDRPGVLYAADERRGTPDSPYGGGRVYALSFDSRNGVMREINHVRSYGLMPSFCAPDPTGRYLLVTHFGVTDDMDVPKLREEIGEPVPYEGTLVLFRLCDDGSVGELLDEVRFPFEDGRATHAHSVRFAPFGDFCLVNEMGTDRLWTFRIEDGRLLGMEFKCGRGTGPRYSAFHPTEPIVYVNYEEQPYIASFSYDADGTLHKICELRTLNESDTAPDDKQSGLAIHPDGRTLYCPMRGKNLVSVVRTDGKGGLTLVQQIKLSGRRPKDCAVSPDGRTLAVANRESDSVEFFDIREDGTLLPTGKTLEKPRTGFVMFV